MAIHQTKRQTDLEKRLAILRRQVYGIPILSDSPSRSVPTKSVSASFQSDVVYLQGDLTKISIFAGSALGLQIILYFLIKNNVLNINIF